MHMAETKLLIWETLRLSYWLLLLVLNLESVSCNHFLLDAEDLRDHISLYKWQGKLRFKRSTKFLEDGSKPALDLTTNDGSSLVNQLDEDRYTPPILIQTNFGGIEKDELEGEVSSGMLPGVQHAQRHRGALYGGRPSFVQSHRGMVGDTVIDFVLTSTQKRQRQPDSGRLEVVRRRRFMKNLLDPMNRFQKDSLIQKMLTNYRSFD